MAFESPADARAAACQIGVNRGLSAFLRRLKAWPGKLFALAGAENDWAPKLRWHQLLFHQSHHTFVMFQIVFDHINFLINEIQCEAHFQDISTETCRFLEAFSRFDHTTRNLCNLRILSEIPVKVTNNTAKYILTFESSKLSQ